MRSLRRLSSSLPRPPPPTAAAAPARQQYGEVLFNEKLRKCTNLQQLTALLEQPTSPLTSAARCIRILQEIGRLSPSSSTSSSPPILTKLFAAAQKQKYTAVETVQFCRALLDVAPAPAPEFIVDHVRALDLTQFNSHTALESLRTLERFPELGELPNVQSLAKVAMTDLDAMTVSQLCALANVDGSNAEDIAQALHKHDFAPLSLVECWDVLSICGLTSNWSLLDKLDREAIRGSVDQFGVPRLVRAFWHAGTPEKLVQQLQLVDKAVEEKRRGLQLSLQRFKQQDDEVLLRVSQSEPPTTATPDAMPRYLVDLMWSLAQMKFDSPPASEVAASVAHEFETQPLDHSALNKRELLQLLFALAKFKIRNPVVLERLLVELVQNDRLAEYDTALELILIVWHFVKLGAHSTQFLDKTTARLNQMDLSKHQLTQKDLSMVLYAYSRFNYRNDELMDKFCVLLQDPKMFHESSAYHVLNLLDYFARMNYSTSAEARKLFAFKIHTLKQMPDVKELSERDLSSLLRSMATLKIQDQDFTDKLVGGVLKKTNELEGKSAAHLIHLLRDISMLQHSAKADAIMPEIVKMLKQEGSLVALPSRELAVLLQSFSKWGFFKDEELLRQITRELLGRGDDLFKGDFRHLSSILVNFGALWVKSGSAGEELLLACADELMTRESLTGVETAALSRLVSAFDKFGYRNQDLMIKVANELLTRDFASFSAGTLHQITKCYAKFKVRNVQLFDEIKAELMRREDWSGFSKQALCEIAASIAALGLTKDSGRLFQKIAGELQPEDLAQLKPKLVADLCFAFGYTKVSDDVLFANLARSLVDDRRAEGLALFSMQRLAVVLWSFSELRQAERNRALFDMVSQHIQDRADFREITSDDLVSILSSFANARFQDRALFNLASQLLQERDLGKMKERELASLVHSYGKVKHKDEQLFALLLGEISRRKTADFTPTALVQILRGFEVFDLARGEWMETLAGDMKRLRGKGMV